MIIEKISKRFQVNEPIFTEDILVAFSEYSRAYVFRLIKEAERKEEIVKFATGIYYIPRKTFFGISTITADAVIQRRYLNWKGDVYGVYSGLKLLNLFSVTTQVPNVIEVVTNNETTRRREILLDGRRFVLRKARVKISKENADAYLILELFSNSSFEKEWNNFSKQRLLEYIREKGISQNQLLSLAMDFPARTMKNLIGSGILYAIAS